MAIFVSTTELGSDLEKAFGIADSRPIMLHSNIMRVGILDRMRPRNEMCSAYLNVIRDAARSSPLLVATFNYDFCRDGIYDIRNSPGQVGVLGDYCRTFFPKLRTRTPVFNFCIFGKHLFDLSECRNPFESESTFGLLHEQDGFVAMLGVGVESATFLHHVEEKANIGYRYIKSFGGKLVYEGSEIPFEIDYRVRPLAPGASLYDWQKIAHDLTEAGILLTYKAGRGTIQMFRAQHYFDFLLAKVREDELYLLTNDSADIARNLYRAHGSPLTWDSVEPLSTPPA